MSNVTDRTFISIDYGRRRIGLAKSDPSGMIASALKTLEVKSWKQAIEQLVNIIDEYKPDGLVVGYPLLHSGDPSEMCKEVDGFIEQLKTVYEGPLHKVDESDTSVEASEIIQSHGKRTGKNKQRIDRLAAVLILQRFLDDTYS